MSSLSTISPDDIVYALNDTSGNITQIHVGGQGGTTGVIVNTNTKIVYVGNPGCNTISVINGTTNSLLTNIPVGVEPRGLDINPNTNIVYVANRASGTVSAIDGVKNKLTAVARFSINPPNAGFIECNGTRISNYTRYDIGSSVKCIARSNSGFQFSSWSSDFSLNKPATISSIFDFIYYLFGNIHTNNTNDPNSYPLTSFIVSKYGTLSANFITSVSIPSDFYWGLVSAIITGSIIPSIGRSIYRLLHRWWRSKSIRKAENFACLYRFSSKTLDVTC